MIHVENKKVIDIVFKHGEGIARIKQGVINEETIYSNPIESISLNGEYPYIPSVNSDNPAYCEINIGDMVEYNFVIENTQYPVASVVCESEDIDISGNNVFFRNQGEYQIELKYKTYRMLINTKVYPITINFN